MAAKSRIKNFGSRELVGKELNIKSKTTRSLMVTVLKSFIWKCSCDEDGEITGFGVDNARRGSEEGQHKFSSFKIKAILMSLGV